MKLENFHKIQIVGELNIQAIKMWNNDTDTDADL